MDKNRTYGLLICIGILLAGLLFIVGVFTGSYVALAIPVTVFTLGVLGLGFWIGWTIFSIKVEPPEPEEKDEAKK
jgi:hypothetical protein